MTTVAEALRVAAARLAQTSDTARLDAELLMAHALGVSRSDMLLWRQQDASPAAFEALVARRARHEPVAQIVGHKEFYGREFRVGREVLTPRADSETTVAAALEAAPAARRVLDCGTGSGALLLTMIAELPEACGIGVDRSPEALRIAADNAALLGLAERVGLFEADWRAEGWWCDLGRFDCVIANPPYVEDSAQLAPSVRDYEPAGALFAGPEGLDDYGILIPHLPKLLEPGGVAVVEIGASQARPVTEIAADAGFSAEVRYDFGRRPRALILRIS